MTTKNYSNPTNPLGDRWLGGHHLTSNPPNPSSPVPGEGFTPPLTLLGKPIRAFSRHVGFSLVALWCPGAGQTTARVAAGKPMGCQGSPKGARRHRKTSPRSRNWSAKCAQTAAWGGLGHPLGRPGAAWGDHRENELGEPVFLAQKSRQFWNPRGPNFDNFRWQFSY